MEQRSATGQEKRETNGGLPRQENSMGLSTELLRGYAKMRDVASAIRSGEDPVVTGLSDTQLRHVCHVLLHETGRKGVYVAWKDRKSVV